MRLPVRIDQFATDPALDRQVYEAWGPAMIPAGANFFLSIGLTASTIQRNIARWNADTAPQREQVAHEVINRTDRKLYGARHYSQPPQTKFKFMILTESINKYRKIIPAHLHGYFAIPDEDLDRFYAVWESVDAGVARAATDLGFRPDIMMQEYKTSEPGQPEYGLKGWHHHADEIWTRQTIRRRDKTGS